VFKHDLVVEAHKSGPVSVKGYVIPFLAPVVGQELGAKATASGKVGSPHGNEQKRPRSRMLVQTALPRSLRRAFRIVLRLGGAVLHVELAKMFGEHPIYG